VCFAVLPIISFVVSVITLILAWFAPLPIIYVIIAFLGLIYAIVGLIVNGYAKEVLNKLPMEFAVEAQKLLSVSLEGTVG